MNSLMEKIQISVLLPLMLFLVAPLALYFGNLNEISFTLSDIWLPISGIVFASSVFVFIFLNIFNKHPKLFAIYCGLLLGLSIAIWVQSQLLNWDFGPLDGRGINWSHWSTHMIFESVIWLFIISISIYFYLSKRFKVAKFIVQGFILLGLLSIITAFISAPKRIIPVVQEASDLENVFKFHPENNVIVIVLDTYQSDYFELIAENYPEEIEFLDGFTFYRNTIGSFPTTAPSMPAIMTARNYDNQQPFKQFIDESYNDFNIISSYADKEFSTEVISRPNVVPGSFEMSNIVNTLSSQRIPAWGEFADYALFKSAPTLFNKYIYNSGDWLISFLFRGNYPPDFHGEDIRFLELFENKAINTLDSYNGAFRFIHFSIPHFPLRVDEKLEFNSDLAGVSGYIKQSRGALKLIRRIFKKLHKLDIYNSSEIVIMTDHGTLSVSPISQHLNENYTLMNLPEHIHSSSLSLLLHKLPGSRGSITIDDSPLYLKDLSCLLRINNENLDCSGFINAVSSGERIRRYYFYDWKHEFWNRDYMPIMTEYLIEGHAYDINSWRPGNYKFEPGGKIKIETFFYQPGTTIYFKENGNSQHIVRGGWGSQESTHRWTTSKKSGLTFQLKSFTESDLLLNIRANAYLAKGEIDHQIIEVYVNGHHVANWKMRGEDWFEAIIPASIVGEDGLINVIFTISDPAAPADFGHSTDIRKLGMSVKEIAIKEKASLYSILQIGDSILFNFNGNSDDYIMFGWSGQESNARWTNNKKAGLSFVLNTNPKNNLILRFYGAPYLASGNISQQNIKVFINNRQITEWNMLGLDWYETLIPANLIGEDRLVNVLFKISDPAAPADYRLSSDTRKLGILARKLLINYVE